MSNRSRKEIRQYMAKMKEKTMTEKQASSEIAGKSMNKSEPCQKCGKDRRWCWCFAEPDAPEGCRCNIPNAGLPLTGDEICQVCGKQV